MKLQISFLFFKMSHERSPGDRSVMAMGGAFGRNERKSSFTQLRLAAVEGEKIRYWWLDFNGAEAGLRTIPVLYLDIPRYK